MQGGARYQNQVTAWLAARMLAERPAAPIIPRGKLTYLAAESGEAVDDVLAGTDQCNFAFVQAKRRLSLSTREGSDLEGVVNQAVRQIAAAVEPDKRSWSRTLNPSSDRLLLVTSSDSPATIRTHLRNVLQRMDGLHPEQTVMDAAKNQGEKDALTDLIALIDREWAKATGDAPTPEEQKVFLKLFDVEVLDPEDGEIHEREAKTRPRVFCAFIGAQRRALTDAGAEGISPRLLRACGLAFASPATAQGHGSTSGSSPRPRSSGTSPAASFHPSPASAGR